MSNAAAVLDDEMEVDSPQQKNAAALSVFPESRGAHLPDWFCQEQRAAFASFSSQRMPNRKDQPWRFSNVDALNLDSYRLPEKLAEQDREQILGRSPGLHDISVRLVFADDQLLQRDALPDALQKRGVIFQPLERALVEHEALFRRHFMSEPAALGSAKFAALHRALVSAGTFLYVPRGVSLELPIEIYHWLHAESAAIFPHLLLVADEMSEITVIEHFSSTTSVHAGFACGVNDLIAGPGAKVTYVCAQNWSDKVVSLQLNATTVARDANALSLNVNLGGAYSRFESQSRLAGEGARSDLLAVAVATGAQEFDARTLQDHASPHTTSDLLYKNALEDRSRTTFGGLIRVEPHAHFTDAYQKVRNLLLSDDAEANSMPGLEIMADNVKCSHGATSGQINDEEFFYLLARGIPASVARKLLVAGFLNEVIDRVPNPTLKDNIRQLIGRKTTGR